MKSKFINECHIEGYLYEHALERKVSGPNAKTPGVEYIRGTVSVATDDAMTNIVPVFYSYVVPTTSGGKTNNTYVVLNNILNGVHGSVMGNGVDKAVKVRIDCALGLNEFPTERNGVEEFVSVKRNEGGFIHIVDTIAEKENARNTFKTDIVITNVRHIEADEERGLPEKAIVKGAIFDFRKALLPVEYSVVNSQAIAYFESADVSASNPLFTCVWGNQISEVIVKRLVTESAFGDDSVREVKNTRKDFVITGALKVPYEWDDENYITSEDFRKMIADRETHVATLKQNREDYKAAKAASAQPTPGGFNF